MNTRKTRQFPLPLSSVVDKADRKKQGAAAHLAKPGQTASRNIVRNMRVDNNPAPLKQTRPASTRLLSSMQGASKGGAEMLVSGSVRRSMVDRLAAQGIRDTVVLAAMESAPRHMFLDPALASQAYIDASLPIGYQQTISQPYIVARMIEILRDNRQQGAMNKVLEIGTGCGYQACVLSMVAKEVYSIERVKGLHELAKTRLRPLRVPNIRLQYGDGMLGLPQAAPFDGIILAAAGLEVPQTLLDQLAVGGRLVAPVGGERQSLQLTERLSQTEWQRTVLEDCFFVPLLGGTV